MFVGTKKEEKQGIYIQNQNSNLRKNIDQLIMVMMK